MKRPAVPSIPGTDQGMYRVLTALKENIELLTGQRGDTIAPLADTATLADVITRLNQVIDRLS